MSILVRQKHWALFEHLSGIFPENQVLFSQKIKIESFLKRYDDFKNNFKNYIQISPLYSYVDEWSFCYIESIYLFTLLSYHLYIFVSLKPP